MAAFVHLLYRVPQDDLVARLVHVQVGSGKDLSLIGDGGIVTDIHQLVEGKHHRHQLAGAVGGTGGGDGVPIGGFPVIYQLHHAVIKLNPMFPFYKPSGCLKGSLTRIWSGIAFVPSLVVALNANSNCFPLLIRVLNMP